MPAKEPPKTIQFKIALDQITPIIWRRLLVSEKSSLLDLHDAIQAVMPWQDYHLHEFTIKGIRYGDPQNDEYHEHDIHDEIDFSLKSLGLQEGSTIAYIYDFGVGWNHTLLVEKISTSERGNRLPKCIAGENTCPPEDVGGASGYEQFLKALNDPKDKDLEGYTQWIGYAFDPQAFDLDAANDRLNESKKRDWAGNLPAEAEEEAARQASLLDPLHWARFRRADWEAASKSLPIRRDVITLTTYMKDNKVTGTESTGNLPRKTVVDITAHLANPFRFDPAYPIKTEDDVWPVYFAHMLANGAALINGGPGRLWRITKAGEIFLETPAVGQVWVLYITWWYRINWLAACHANLSGEFFYEQFRNSVSSFLKTVPSGKVIVFDEFANHLIEESGWTWKDGKSNTKTHQARAAIEDMVIEPLENLGILKTVRGEDPHARLNAVKKPLSFALTEFGEILIKAV